MNQEKCMERDHLFAYAQRLLESNEECEVREHVAQCARCQEAVAAFQRLDAVLDEWKPAAPSSWFDARVRAAVEANPPARFPFGLFGLRWAQVLAPACLVVLVTFATLLTTRQQPSDAQERLTKSSATKVEEELTLYKDLPVLEDEDFQMLANFDVLSALPHGDAKVEN